jgi:hypothetical protein
MKKTTFETINVLQMIEFISPCLGLAKLLHAVGTISKYRPMP